MSRGLFGRNIKDSDNKTSGEKINSKQTSPSDGLHLKNVVIIELFVFVILLGA